MPKKREGLKLSVHEKASNDFLIRDKLINLDCSSNKTLNSNFSNPFNYLAKCKIFLIFSFFRIGKNYICKGVDFFIYGDIR